MERLRKNASTFKLLHKAKPSLRKAIITKASPELIRCICDCALDVLHRNIAITPHCKRKLSQHKTSLKKLTDKKVSLNTKRKILQQGGFLPLILSALTPLVGKIIGGLTQ